MIVGYWLIRNNCIDIYLLPRGEQRASIPICRFIPGPGRNLIEVQLQGGGDPPEAPLVKAVEVIPKTFEELRKEAASICSFLAGSNKNKDDGTSRHFYSLLLRGRLWRFSTSIPSKDNKYTLTSAKLVLYEDSSSRSEIQLDLKPLGDSKQREVYLLYKLGCIGRFRYYWNYLVKPRQRKVWKWCVDNSTSIKNTTVLGTIVLSAIGCGFKVIPMLVAWYLGVKVS